MRAEQISVFLENKAGRLAEVAAILAEADVNIRALALADTSDFGVLRLIVNDNQKAIQVLLQLIKTAGDEQRSLSALDRLYANEKQWQELSDVIERQLTLGVVDPEDELELKYRLGQVSEKHLNDKRKALMCYQEILIPTKNYWKK